jgi:hypothetical protein
MRFGQLKRREFITLLGGAVHATRDTDGAEAQTGGVNACSVCKPLTSEETKGRRMAAPVFSPFVVKQLLLVVLIPLIVLG